MRSQRTLRANRSSHPPTLRVCNTHLVAPTFRRGPVEQPKSESPERLFDDLPRTRAGVPSLWAHQADMLREYHDNHLSTADVAFELPTGAGKTLPALLVAEWRRRSLGNRVAYACPTVQLAHQVHAEALRQGIDAVALLGSHHDWETADSSKYDSAQAVAITTYNSIFNLSPKLAPPQTLLFDDAHNGEQFVAQAWSIAISRYHQPDLYQRVLEVIGPELSGLRVQRLQATDPDPRIRGDVNLLPLGAMRRRVQHLDLVLRAAADIDIKFRYAMIGSALEHCLLYFGWEGFLIRPYIAPTAEHSHFTEAIQRVYISATLGDGGELERAFGWAPIQRLPVPAGWDQRASGRRFFVFPELIRNFEPRTIARAIIDEAGKALVIAPSDRRLDRSIVDLVPEGVEVFRKGQIERSLDGFRRAEHGVLALANRYDGIDLADESCRVTVLDGLPTGEHLQERFLIRSLRVGRVLEERLRTRVVQGAGRCTRGLKDHSAVIVLGDDLTRFLQRTEVRSALRPETQAEIAFGIYNSDNLDHLRASVSSFLDQDDDWQDDAEPAIAELRRESTRSMPPGTEALAAAAPAEVKAWGQLWRGEHLAASETAVEVARRLADESVLSPYRALWLYFAASWQDAAAEATGDQALAAGARELHRRAHATARGTTWLREVEPLPAGELVLDPVDELAVAAVARHPARKMSGSKWAGLVQELTEGLNGTEAPRYERALSVLGGLVGAEAEKPIGKGRADSIWIFGDLWWLTLEAKSDVEPTRLVSMQDIRQANTQLRSLASDRQTETPEGSLSVVVTPCRLVDPDAVVIAEGHVHLCSPAAIWGLAGDAVEAWGEIRAAATNLEGEEGRAVIVKRLIDHRLLPSAVRERIADRPAAG